jgi:hypothetical protein
LPAIILNYSNAYLISNLFNVNKGWFMSNLVFYYNSDTGGAAVGVLDSSGNHATLKGYNTFATGWTHIVNGPQSIFFYNMNTGAGVVGRIDASGNFSTLKEYDTFATGWTHIVNGPQSIFFYNMNTGAGVVGRIDASGNFSTLKEYDTFATGWTHIVNGPQSIFFYNMDTGAGVVGRIDASGNFSTLKEYDTFATGWTHIANTSKGLLFYCMNTGSGAVGIIDAAGNFSTIKGYGVKSFSTWTHIADETAGLEFRRPTILPDVAQWALSMTSAGKVDFNGGTIIARRDGSWQFWGSLHDNSTWYGDSWSYGFVFDASGHGAIAYGSLGAEYSGPPVNGNFNISGNDPWITANWELVATSGVNWKLHVQEDIGGILEECANLLGEYGPGFVALLA